MRIILSLILLVLVSACTHFDEQGKVKVVYFDTGKATLKEESLVTLKEVVNDYINRQYYGAPWKHDNCHTKFSRHCNAINQSVIIIGHTDTVDDANSNIALSQRRAEAVETKLIELGVDTGVFQTSFRGESELAVPTKDGISEPLNRRAEISVY